MTATGTDDLSDAAREVLGDVVALRRDLHRHPELGLDLPRTQAAVLDKLAPLDLDITRGSSLSSIFADLRGASDGPVVLLRADMDALPMPEDTGLDFASEQANTMHACGHDAHTAMLVGAAQLLAARRDDLAGTVRFMFQPGEEGFHGARSMIEEGVLDDPSVDVAYALHVTPNLPAGMVGCRPGPQLASADVFTIRITGRGGHASQPHLANDPMPVAAEIVTALQTFVTRRIDAFDPAVITISTIRGGTTDNVIPEHVEMTGTLRTVSERTRAKAQAGIERTATGIASAHEMNAGGDRVSRAIRQRSTMPDRSRPWLASRAATLGRTRVRRDARAGHGGGGLQLRPRSPPGSDRVPRCVSVGVQAVDRAGLPLESNDDRRGRHGRRSRDLRRPRDRGPHACLLNEPGPRIADVRTSDHEHRSG